ncbi:hypothetical protein HYALB_00000268 [Hymenoscyphus albidus]|uniref:FAS1 domain-containing protein n=1 Tax=Hymenoscyphus albidus TaxID=595503 RepID=A0A9N9LU30_9HELO|nr:hypothetical protein HYALB_00000268 [Hymenoscyphus albidus]
MLFNKIVSLAAFASLAWAQSITDVLTQNKDNLSALIGLLATQPELLKSIAETKDITILAPNNKAIETLLSTDAGKAAAANPALVKAILQYHVLSGVFPSTAFSSKPAFAASLLTDATYANVTGGQRVKAVAPEGRPKGTVIISSGLLADSNVVVADVKFDGGVIHVIDEVLTIPTAASVTAAAANLTALTGALTTANLVGTVDGLKDVTIFAPSNAAFEAIAATTAGLSVQQLSSILTYHVVAGTVGYSSTLTNTKLKTVNGAELEIKVSGADVFVNQAKVIVADVLIAGGVVHVIDGIGEDEVTDLNSSVLLPSGSGTNTSTPSPNATASATPTPNVVLTSGAGSTMGAVGLGALVGGAALLFNL